MLLVRHFSKFKHSIYTGYLTEIPDRKSPMEFRIECPFLIKYPTILYLTLLFLGESGIAQSLPNINPNEIDHLVLSAMQNWHIPGCAIVITSGEEIIYTQGYGYRNVEDKLLITPRTVFKIASCTKSFTAAAAGLLVNKRLLEWDKPLKDYLPDLKLHSEYLTAQVTLRDCLSHRTGLYDDDWAWVGDHIDSNRLYEIIEAMPVRYPFRTNYQYSNVMYALVGSLLTKFSHNSWRELIRNNFFVPLSMESACFSHNQTSGLNDFAYGYEYNEQMNRYVRGNLNEHFTDSLSVCESFGFISASVTDLAKWVQTFISGGKYKSKTIIPGEILNEVLKPHNFISLPEYPELSESYYTLGWIQNYYKGHKLLQHSGGLSGFKSYMSFMPGDSLGIVVLTNGQPYQFPQALTFDLYDRVLGFYKTNWLQRHQIKIIKEIPDSSSSEKYPGTKPNKPLHEYAGLYHSKWLGNMVVIYYQGELYFQFHQYPPEKMTHAHFETFYTSEFKGSEHGITFLFTHNGEITGLMLNEFKFDKK